MDWNEQNDELTPGEPRAEETPELVPEPVSEPAPEPVARTTAPQRMVRMKKVRTPQAKRRRAGDGVRSEMRMAAVVIEAFN